MSLIQTAVLALVALVLGLFVIRPILTSAAAAGTCRRPDPTLGPAAGDGLFGAAALDGEVETGFAIAGLSGHGPRRDRGRGAEDDPATRLRRLIEKRQTESIEILRGWMEQEEERA